MVSIENLAPMQLLMPTLFRANTLFITDVQLRPIDDTTVQFRRVQLLAIPKEHSDGAKCIAQNRFFAAIAVSSMAAIFGGPKSMVG